MSELLPSLVAVNKLNSHEETLLPHRYHLEILVEAKRWHTVKMNIRSLVVVSIFTFK